MPRYDYRCEAGHKYELTQPFGSPAVHSCHKCGKEARRLLVAPPLVFKAGGYYKTESRGGLTRSDRDDSSSSDSEKKSKKPAAKSEGKSEAQSEAQAEKPAKTDKPARPSKPAASAD